MTILTISNVIRTKIIARIIVGILLDIWQLVNFLLGAINSCNINIFFFFIIITIKLIIISTCVNN